MKRCCWCASWLIFLLQVGSGVRSIQAFQLLTPGDGRVAAFRRSSSTCPSRLEARRVKRQSLGSIAEDGIVSTPKKVKKASTSKVKTSTTTGTTTDNKSGQISSDLAKWAASQTENSSDQQGSAPAMEKTSDVVQFAPFENRGALDNKNDRRMRQSDRMIMTNERDEAVRALVDELEEELENKNNLESILGFTKKLIQLESTPLKQLTATTSSTRNYRLAWVGSDAAICHIGTSQHKVPLARLQEIFLILEGKNRLQLYEVISLLGPFPNIRNTLQGSCQVTGSDPFTWNLVYDSMIDGMGKELLAGKEGNVQRVDLQVYFCDTNAIVAVVPPKDGSPRSDPLQFNGEDVLLFVREDDMESKLDAMRVL